MNQHFPLEKPSAQRLPARSTAFTELDFLAFPVPCLFSHGYIIFCLILTVVLSVSSQLDRANI